MTRMLCEGWVVPTHVALLRGVNLGNRRVSMPELRKLLERLGYTDVGTYVQSGNAVFTSKRKAESRIASELEAELRTALGFDVPVIVRRRADLAQVVAKNPFPDAAADPTKLHVTFIAKPLDPGSLESIPAADFNPEEFVIRKREVYLSLPNGLGRSKLAVAMERALRGSGTTRNWRTVTALLDLLEG
jgi:uncharacterized protein (DUF1697 family)